MLVLILGARGAAAGEPESVDDAGVSGENPAPEVVAAPALESPAIAAPNEAKPTHPAFIPPSNETHRVAPAPPSSPPADLPKVSMARWLPLGTTIIGIGVGNVVSIVSLIADSDTAAFVGLDISIAALCVGPSLGHYYIGNPGRATATMLVRLALAAVPHMYPVLRSPSLYEEDDNHDYKVTDPDLQLGVEMAAITIVALAGVVTLAVIDIRSARKQARRAHDLRSGSASFALAPLLFSRGGQTNGAGAALLGDF